MSSEAENNPNFQNITITPNYRKYRAPSPLTQNRKKKTNPLLKKFDSSKLLKNRNPAQKIQKVKRDYSKAVTISLISSQNNLKERSLRSIKSIFGMRKKSQNKPIFKGESSNSNTQNSEKSQTANIESTKTTKYQFYDDKPNQGNFNYNEVFGMKKTLENFKEKKISLEENFKSENKAIILDYNSCFNTVEDSVDGIQNFALRSHFLKHTIYKNFPKNQSRIQKVNNLKNYLKLFYLKFSEKSNFVKKSKKIKHKFLAIETKDTPNISYNKWEMDQILKMRFSKKSLESPKSDYNDNLIAESSVKRIITDEEFKNKEKLLISSPIKIASPDAKEVERPLDLQFFTSNSKKENIFFQKKNDVSFENNEKKASQMVETASFNPPELDLEILKNLKKISKFNLKEENKKEVKKKKSKKKKMSKSSSFNQKTLRFFKENSKIFKELITSNFNQSQSSLNKSKDEKNPEKKIKKKKRKISSKKTLKKENKIEEEQEEDEYCFKSKNPYSKR